MIRYNDFYFGNLLEKFHSLNIYDDSMIILVSDHGQGFMEHGFNSHGGIVYEEQIRIPLLVKFPKNKYAGRIIETPVQIIDIMPTILETIGIKYNGEIDGKSLFDIINGSSESRIIFCENKQRPNSIWSASIRIGKWKWLKVVFEQESKFNLSPKGLKKWLFEKIYKLKCQFKNDNVYDLKEDPDEKSPNKFTKLNNLPDFPNILNNILLALEKRADKIKYEKIGEEKIDSELENHLRGMGYID